MIALLSILVTIEGAAIVFLLWAVRALARAIDDLAAAQLGR